MNEQNKTVQQVIEETKIHVPAGAYNILELYKFIDALHLRMGRQTVKDLLQE